MKMTPTNIALALIVATVLLYVVGLRPLLSTLAESRKDLSEERTRLQEMKGDIARSAELNKKMDELGKASDERRQALISPMLNSFAMRAKALVGRFADESGIESIEYGEGELRTLPIPPEGIPEVRTARRMVRIRADGDYAAIASFLLRIEHELPLVTLQALTIRQDEHSDAEIQSAEMILEWPCEGMVIK